MTVRIRLYFCILRLQICGLVLLHVVIQFRSYGLKPLLSYLLGISWLAKKKSWSRPGLPGNFVESFKRAVTM